VLVGGTSEIGLSILRSLNLDRESSVMIIGRKLPHVNELLGLPINLHFVNADIENEDDLRKLRKRISSLNTIDLVIMACGYLPPENCDTDPIYVAKSLKINSFGVVILLAALAEKIINQKKAGHIVYISSVATMRPRIQNFTYGASKKAADFFAEGLFFKYRNQGLYVHTLRPGFVFTKMSKNFKPAPFAIGPREVAAATLRGMKRGRRIIYAPSILMFVMKALVFLPRRIFDWLK
jgi:decaprenylphospho-beta-D-erythro-pentofuranosid-2-ulose 2-reductase